MHESVSPKDKYQNWEAPKTSESTRGAVSGEIGRENPKAAERAREELYTKVDIALRRLKIEALGSNSGLSEPEARALVAKMQEAVGGFVLSDKAFLNEMQAKGEPFFDTKRTIKLTTATGNEAVFKVMLKTDTGKFKLQGDVLDPKGKYAEKLMD